MRKHLSQVKGGGLARWVFPATLVSFLLSDVIGDDPSTIGSGPTVPDPGTFHDAWNVLEQYDLLERVPPKILTHLRQGLTGVIPERATLSFWLARRTVAGACGVEDMAG